MRYAPEWIACPSCGGAIVLPLALLATIQLDVHGETWTVRATYEDPSPVMHTCGQPLTPADTP